MQVVTLNPSDFEEHARKLAKAVEEGSGRRFDAIVAVRRGGSIVCDAFCRHFPKDLYGGRYDVTLQRPSTKKKGGRVSRILKLLPYPLLDAMRIAEALLLNLKRGAKRTAYTPEMSLPEGLSEILKTKKSPAVLVIDDAIDSGHTLSAIAESLRKANPDTSIKTAVMTVTTVNPCIQADYTLYRNRTLIRFPWSNDYKEN